VSAPWDIVESASWRGEKNFILQHMSLLAPLARHLARIMTSTGPATMGSCPHQQPLPHTHKQRARASLELCRVVREGFSSKQCQSWRQDSHPSNARAGHTNLTFFAPCKKKWRRGFLGWAEARIGTYLERWPQWYGRSRGHDQDADECPIRRRHPQGNGLGNWQNRRRRKGLLGSRLTEN
jgi:hypothetical protein